MTKLEFRVRNLETRELLEATCASEIDALRWLRERPRFMEVLAVLTHDLTPELHGTLRAAARPLDPDELALSATIDADERAARLQGEEDTKRLALEESEAHRAAMLTADPDRPMSIEWSIDGGMHVVDPSDTRPITEAAREAVLAWVRERDEWIRERGQIVGEASVNVYPGSLPASACGDRIVPGGLFFPTAARSAK